MMGNLYNSRAHAFGGPLPALVSRLSALSVARFWLSPLDSPIFRFVCSEFRHPIETSKNRNFANAFLSVTLLDITSPARTQPRPRADAKLRLRAGYQEQPAASFACMKVALIDNA
jgi:hypothetical protein